MAQRTETRFGEVTSLGTTYVSIGTVPAAAVWNVKLNVANRTASVVKVRAYIADTSWTTGEPTGGTLKVAVLYDAEVNPGAPAEKAGVVMNAGEKLVVRADTASSLDVFADGVTLAS